eukprot:CAMPEP_0114052672 /NCGR_PEP_ID=MMETSP1339-20121228/76572_1 /TAXON_ID=94617 /ORGANISM="Fibrocapsa japonica" /LENGTH=48 /assembly_acc=CAM_ASM_000762
MDDSDEFSDSAALDDSMFEESTDKDVTNKKEQAFKNQPYDEGFEVSQS